MSIGGHRCSVCGRMFCDCGVRDGADCYCCKKCSRMDTRDFDWDFGFTLLYGHLSGAPDETENKNNVLESP